MNYWVWFSQIKGIGIQLQRALLCHFQNPKQIYFASKEELLQVRDFGNARAEYILNNKSLENANRILGQCERKEIRIMTLQDAIYPVYAKEILEMPCIFRLNSALFPEILSI